MNYGHNFSWRARVWNQENAFLVFHNMAIANRCLSTRELLNMITYSFKPVDKKEDSVISPGVSFSISLKKRVWHVIQSFIEENL